MEPFTQKSWWVDKQEHRHTFLKCCPPLHWQAGGFYRWPLTRIMLFFLLSVVKAAYNDLQLYFELSAFYWLWRRMRGLNIRSISMDFRFESPGECWALWKNSTRATKGKTSKHRGEGKKSIPYDLWFKGYAFFSQDTSKKHFCQCKYCSTFVVVAFISQ